MKTSFHTHTTFCDGKDTPTAVAQEAYEKGLDVLGFSAHSFTKHDTSWCLHDEQAYRQEVNSLKKAYQGKMDIYLGEELDFYGIRQLKTAYTIGSVHFLLVDGVYLPVDESAKRIEADTKTHFSGDFSAYATAYFDSVGSMVKKFSPDIVGHVDLLSKFAESDGLFANPTTYLAVAKQTLMYILPFCRSLEINTGAMARGLRTTPYPAQELLAFWHSIGGKVTLTADVHDKNFLLYGDDFARRFCLEIGYKKQTVIYHDIWQEVDLSI